MKHLLTFVAFLVISISTNAQNASVQLIHGIADTNFQTIDIWLFNTKIADNISFREATEYISFPAVIETQLRICDSASTDTINPLLLFKEQLSVGEKYIMVASGISDSAASYSHYQPLTFHFTTGARELSEFPRYSDGIFFHAATDLETLSISETRELFEELEMSLAYGNFSNYNELETSNYRLRLKELNALFPTGEFDAFLSSLNLDDSSVVILISGFKNPELNSDGPSLSIDLVTSSGNVYNLPLSSGKLQFLHNSADPELNEVDIYINGRQELNSLNFISASGYLSFPSGTELEVAITLDSAGSANEALFTKSIVIDANTDNIAVLSGLNGPGFSPAQPLDITLKKSRTTALNANDCDIIFFNGSTDFGVATLKEGSILNSDLFTNIEYGDFSEYTSLPATNYRVDLYSGTELFATNGLNLESYNLSGASITLLSLGFVDTLANSNGQEFGLWFARSTSGKFTKLSNPIGINEENNLAPKLFPNPSSAMVEVSSAHEIQEVRMYNTHGQLILNEKINSTSGRIDISSLPSGLYNVEFSSAKRVQFEKLIIE